jgi:hypothetical protein
MDGFDANDLGTKWTQIFGGAASTTALTRFNTGRSVTISNYFWGIRKILPVASSKIFVGFALNTAAGSPGHTFLTLWGDSAASIHLRLEAASDVAFRIVRSDGTVLATSANGAHAAGIWEYVEVMATIADSGGRVTVRVNGATVIDFTGDTRNGGTNASIDTIGFGDYGTNVGPVTASYFDDVYVCNDTGTTNNTFLGDVRVQTLPVTGAGTDTQLTPTGVANNWDNINEMPASASDYNSSSTVGQRDTYVMQDLLATTGSVFGVQTNLTVGKSDAGTANMKPVLRSGGSVYYDPAIVLSSSAALYTIPHDTDPATSTNWTVSGVNGLETGVETA